MLDSCESSLRRCAITVWACTVRRSGGRYTKALRFSDPRPQSFSDQSQKFSRCAVLATCTRTLDIAQGLAQGSSGLRIGRAHGLRLALQSGPGFG